MLPLACQCPATGDIDGMPNRDDIWYAAENTQVLFASDKTLETFGQTVLRYYVLTELLDTINQVRVREGLIHAERPQVITPHYFANELVENFGDEARQYADRLIHSAEGMRILQYGLRFRKQERSEETVAGDIREVGERIVNDVKERESELCGVIVGVDDLWEVSLLKFASDVVRGSVSNNVRELHGSGLLSASGNGVPNAVRIEIESDFRKAAGNAGRVNALGDKLRRYGLFEDYEDRFYALFRALR